METETLISIAPWLPGKSSLRPLCESIYPGQPHQRPITANPMTALGRGHSPPCPRFVKYDLDVIPQKSFDPSVQDHLSAIEDRAPKPPDPGRFANADLDFIARKTWTEQKEKVVLGPYDYIASKPGKEFRTLLLNALNAWLEVRPETLAIITDVVRMLHTASLLIDDIQDNSMLRRGRPVAHRIFGVAQTINAANYVYFRALRELQKLSNPAAAVEIFTTELLHLHWGQGMDLFWRDTLTCPTEEDYLEMISNKTGGLFRLAVKLMQAESGTSIDCMPLVQLLGPIFQIVDDYRNLSNLDYMQQKGLCEDLTEGKFSFPVIHSIRSDPTNLQLLHILAQKPTEVDTKRCAVEYIESTGSLEYTKQVVEALIGRAKDVADAVDQGRGKSQGIHAVLDKLALK